MKHYDLAENNSLQGLFILSMIIKVLHVSTRPGN